MASASWSMLSRSRAPSVRPSLLGAHVVVIVVAVAAIVAMHAHRQPGLQIVGVVHHRRQARAVSGGTKSAGLHCMRVTGS